MGLGTGLSRLQDIAKTVDAAQEATSSTVRASKGAQLASEATQDAASSAVNAQRGASGSSPSNLNGAQEASQTLRIDRPGDQQEAADILTDVPPSQSGLRIQPRAPSALDLVEPPQPASPTRLEMTHDQKMMRDLKDQNVEQRDGFIRAHDKGASQNLNAPKDQVAYRFTDVRLAPRVAHSRMVDDTRDLQFSLDAPHNYTAVHRQLTPQARGEIVKGTQDLIQHARPVKGTPLATAEEMRGMRATLLQAVETLPMTERSQFIEQLQSPRTVQTFSSGTNRTMLDEIGSDYMSILDGQERTLSGWSDGYPELKRLGDQTLDGFARVMDPHRRKTLLSGEWAQMEQTARDAYLHSFGADLAEEMGIVTPHQRMQQSVLRDDGPIPQDLAAELSMQWSNRPLALSLEGAENGPADASLNFSDDLRASSTVTLPRDVARDDGPMAVRTIFHEFTHVRQHHAGLIYEQILLSKHIERVPAQDRPAEITRQLQNLGINPEHARGSFLSMRSQVVDSLDTKRQRDFYYDDRSESEAWDMETRGLERLVQTAEAERGTLIRGIPPQGPARTVADLDWSGRQQS